MNPSVDRIAVAPGIVTWQTIMQQAVGNIDELLVLLQLERKQLPALDNASHFPLRVPHSFIRRMRAGDPTDPLLLQVLPLGLERDVIEGFGADPVGEASASHGSGIVSKYADRTLLVTTASCPLHCRYCFRRHFPYQERSLRNEIDAAVEKLRTMDHEEIILSGGDPLSLSNGRLSRLVGKLQSLEGLKRLRLHTRFPVVVPERIDRGLLDLLASIKQSLIIVMHINHAREIDDSVIEAMQSLRESGATLLNQSVLLAGINATATAQIELAKALCDAGVMPYYLHQLDPVAGAAHFDVADHEAIRILAAMRQSLPGYLVPRLVREQAGADAKTPLTE